VNLINLLFISLSVFSLSNLERRNSLDCIDGVFKRDPAIQVIPEHNLVVETRTHNNNQLRIIHTEMGSVISWDAHTDLTCTPELSSIGKVESMGYYHYTSEYLSRLLGEVFERSMAAGENSPNVFLLEAALRTLPVSCANSHPQSITHIVSGYCEVLRTRPQLISGSFDRVRVCNQ